MIGHVVKYIVVNVAKEMNLGFNTPIIAGVFQGRVVIEQPRIPAAHLVIGHEIPILDLLFFQYLGRLLEQVVVDPRGDVPMLHWYQVWSSLSASILFECGRLKSTVTAFGFRDGLCSSFEFFGERYVVEEAPWIIELGVPRSF